jgi:molecular chaperone DnaK (HSP70)
MGNVRLAELRFGAALAALALAACAGPKGAVDVGVHSPPLGEGVLLVDDVGLDVPGSGFAPVLARGCELPCKGTFIARTTSKNQKRIRIELLRRSYGRRPTISRLATFEIIEVPPGAAGQHVVQITLRAKKDLLTISAEEEETGAASKIRTLLMLGE